MALPMVHVNVRCRPMDETLRIGEVAATGPSPPWEPRRAPRASHGIVCISPGDGALEHRKRSRHCQQRTAVGSARGPARVSATGTRRNGVAAGSVGATFLAPLEPLYAPGAVVICSWRRYML